MRECLSPGPDRDHTIYRYTDQIYKIIQWYAPRMPVVRGPRSEYNHYDRKLESSLSRSRRVVLEKALCNHWDYFCTFTIASDKADRHDLPGWWKRFAQWLRDERKKGYDIKYLLVPERHKDGSWHAHGFLTGVPDDQVESFRAMDARGYRLPSGRRLPRNLINSGYFNWSAYQSKFGFCSLGKIRNPVACAFYVTKYITKDVADMVSQVGMHMYYCSRPLAGAQKHMDFYGRDPEIDSFLSNKYDFCATGMTHVKDGLDWTFALSHCDFSTIEPLQLGGDQLTPIVHSAVCEAEQYHVFEQLAFNL